MATVVRESDDDGVWRQHLYLQTRLKEKNGRIRLLTIQPRQYTASRPEAPQDTIHCFLRLAELSARPPFTAVSHRWQPTDSISPTASVLVNGAAVPVSPGLFSLLQALQNETEAVVVWIDALCINHADGEQREKSVQVAQLARIFASAEKTVIWLGEEGKDGEEGERSGEAMRVLRRLAEEQLTLSAYVANWTPQLGQQLVQKILPARFIHPTGPAHPHPHTHTPTPATKEPADLQQDLESLRAPLKALMERPYWTHLWSLVELCLSSRGLVVCGGHGLALDHFAAAARALDHIINHLMYSKWLAAATSPATPAGASTPAAAAGFVLRSEEVSNLSHSPALRVLARRDEYRKDADSWLKTAENPLFGLLTRFFAAGEGEGEGRGEGENGLGLRIGDRRDRVYALACLATDTAELGIEVDYGKGVESVYEETSAAFLRKGPRVLQLARGTRGIGEGEGQGQASWAVDWENVRLPPSYLGPGAGAGAGLGPGPSDRPFNACGPADIRFYRADTGVPGQIALKAGVVDKVQEVGSTYLPHPHSHSHSHSQAEPQSEPETQTDEPEPGLGSTEQQRAYLAEIRRFWEDSTASLSSPYFAAQAAVALAKIPVGDIEVGSTSTSASASHSISNSAFVRASSATVEGYKRTVEALFPAENDSSTDEDDEDGGEAAAADTHTPAPVEGKEGDEEEGEKKRGGQGEKGKERRKKEPSLPYLAAMARMSNRRPFRSQNGYVGLGPADLAVGDTVAIPYGSAVPFAFRRGGSGSGSSQEGEDATYYLVGEVYVFGIMDGEFMKVHRQESVLKIV
ncbi:heterokaryon incompatibility protein-domain-containing protein [Nemania sp. FL0031]|nr:heterokaryon incompatibility protein-domain-containing protein [Nemania sp. FL0031]